MNDPGLDPDTAERMLCGQPTGPPRLARLLAAAAAHPEIAGTEGEQAALTAFHAGHRHQRSRRRIHALISLKAALIGLALLLTGGVAMAATANHLAGPPGDREAQHAETPDTARTFLTREAPSRSPRPAPPRRRPAPHQKNETHPENTPKGKAKGNPHKAPAS